MYSRRCSAALGRSPSSSHSRVPRGRRRTVRDYFYERPAPTVHERPPTTQHWRLRTGEKITGPGQPPWTPAISPSKPAGPRGRTRDRAVRGVSSWYPQRTASCFPRVKARAASHRACASSSVRHDTTSLPFLSLFLTLPTPPPPTPLALSPSCHDFCSAPGRDEARGERGWLAGSRSLNKRLDDVREWTTPRDHRKSIDDRGRGERNDTRVDLVRNRSSKDFCA